MKKPGKFFRILLAFLTLALLSSSSLFFPAARALAYRSLFYAGSPPLRAWSIEGLAGLREDGAAALGSIALDPQTSTKQRLDLLFLLAELKAEAAPATPMLAALLADSDPKVATEAATSLRAIGPGAAPATPALITALASQDGPLRRSAALALGAIGPKASAAIPALIERLRDTPAHVREALDAIDPAGNLPGDELIAELERRPDRLRLYASFVRERNMFSGGDSEVPTLVRLLEDERAKVRIYAVWSLGSLESCNPEVFAGVNKLFKDPEEAVRLAALQAFEELYHSEHEQELAALIAVASSDPDPTIRARGMRFLACLGQGAGGIETMLRAALKEPSPELRCEALLGLKSIGAWTEADLPRLIEGLKDPNPRVQNAVLIVLGSREGLEAAAPEVAKEMMAMPQHHRLEQSGLLYELGPAACAPLLEVFEKEDGAARVNAARALAMLGSDASEAVPSLTRSLESSSPDIRAMAVKVLGAIGPMAAPVLPGLLAALEDENQVVRGAAVVALRGVGIASPEVIAALGKILEDTDREMRRRALAALSELNPRSINTVPLLRPMLRDPDPEIRAEAIVALGQRGSEAAGVVPELIGILNRASPSLRWRAADALASIGAEAEAAIPALEVAAAQSSDPEVKRSAAQAAEIIRSATEARSRG